MSKCWRTFVAAVVLGGTGCCHLCECCDWCGDSTPPPRNAALPPGQPPPEGIVPPVGPRPGAGAYGGTGQ